MPVSMRLQYTHPIHCGIINGTICLHKYIYTIYNQFTSSCQRNWINKRASESVSSIKLYQNDPFSRWIRPFGLFLLALPSENCQDTQAFKVYQTTLGQSLRDISITFWTQRCPNLRPIRTNDLASNHCLRTQTNWRLDIIVNQKMIHLVRQTECSKEMHYSHICEYNWHIYFLLSTILKVRVELIPMLDQLQCI